MATVRPSGDMANPPPNELTGSIPGGYGMSKDVSPACVADIGPPTIASPATTVANAASAHGSTRRQRDAGTGPGAARPGFDALLVVEVRARVADIAKPPPDVLDQTAFDAARRAARLLAAPTNRARASAPPPRCR